jgi:Rrf2 family protein
LNAPADGRTDASVRDLAELQGVPLEYLAKLFTKLSKASLVVATEGARGGFALARRAEEISFLDVVKAIDGDKPLFECREIRTRCAVFDEETPDWATKDVCSIHAVMLAAEKCMRDELASHSLAEIAAQVTAKAPSDYESKVVAWLGDRSSNRRVDRDPAVKSKEY